MSDDQQKMAMPGQGRAVHNTHHPWWHTALSGRIYRPVMRLMHRLGWCYPQGTLIDARSVWCQWCGMRGDRPPPIDNDVAREMMARKMSDRAAGRGWADDEQEQP